jgi:hypothetical protein
MENTFTTIKSRLIKDSTGVQGKNNVYHIKEKMRKMNFKLFGKSFLIVG